METIFFAKQSALRKWFEENHQKENELWIGYYKKQSGKPSITWPESVDVALCFGWIDGIRKSIDAESYGIRFTPRKPKSTWSAVNIKRIKELIALELVHQKGIEAFERREESNSKIYSFEQKTVKFEKSYQDKFKDNKKAWDFFQSQIPSYQKPAIHWIMSAKKEETRLKRLNALIKDSEQGQHIKFLRRSNKKSEASQK